MPLIISACEEIEREEANLHEEFIVSEPPPHIVLYSFGQPKAGNAAFAAMVRPYIHTHYRVELDGDMVATLPPGYVGYSHSGTQVIVDPHAAGSLVVNPTIVESYLLAGHHASMLKHTMERYRACLKACFNPRDFEEYTRTEHDQNGRRNSHGFLGGKDDPNDSYGRLERQLRERGMKRNYTEVPQWAY